MLESSAARGKKLAGLPAHLITALENPEEEGAHNYTHLCERATFELTKSAARAPGKKDAQEFPGAKFTFAVARRPFFRENL